MYCFNSESCQIWLYILLSHLMLFLIIVTKTFCFHSFRLCFTASGENRSSRFPTRSNTNRSVQPQKMARGMKFWIEEVEEMYYLSTSESKGTDQLCGSANAKSRFSHDA